MFSILKYHIWWENKCKAESLPFGKNLQLILEGKINVPIINLPESKITWDFRKTNKVVWQLLEKIQIFYFK